MEEKKPKPRTPKSTENISPKVEEVIIPQTGEVTLEENPTQDEIIPKEDEVSPQIKSTMEEQAINLVQNISDFLNRMYS